jgi:hypothetical protein
LDWKSLVLGFGIQDGQHFWAGVNCYHGITSLRQRESQATSASAKVNDASGWRLNFLDAIHRRRRQVVVKITERPPVGFIIVLRPT